MPPAPLVEPLAVRSCKTLAMRVLFAPFSPSSATRLSPAYVTIETVSSALSVSVSMVNACCISPSLSSPYIEPDVSIKNTTLLRVSENSVSSAAISTVISLCSTFHGQSNSLPPTASASPFSGRA